MTATDQVTVEQQTPERIDYRDLPAVEEPIEPKDRYRQTFLKRFALCARSAYLYERYNGGAPSHELLRGSAAHEVFELATKECLSTGEIQIPFEIVKTIVNEVLARYVLPPDEADAVRIMAYHWAEAVTLDLRTLAGVEQKFSLDVDGTPVTGKIDRLHLRQDADYGTIAEIIDYKTSLHLPEQDDYGRPRRDKTLQWTEFQGLVYALGVAFGEFEGGVQLGAGINLFQISQVFPMYLIDDDRAGLFLAQRSATLERDELQDSLAYLHSLVANLRERYEDQKWQAIPGSHCSECAAKWECPIPPALRDMHGTIDTPDDAIEACLEWEFDKRKQDGLKREIKNWADAYAPAGIRFGKDFIMQFFSQDRTEIKDKEGLQVAVERAVEFGEPFDIEKWVKRSTSTRFDKKKLTPEQLREEQHE